MNTYAERQPRAVNRLVSMLERLNRLAVSVMAAPTEARDRGGQLTGGAEVPPTSGFEDDLANATWEDAEWR